MATAKPKVKRMMFGGSAKAAPVRTQSQMQAAASKAPPKQMQFMSGMLRGAPMQGAAKQVPAYAKPYADKQAAPRFGPDSGYVQQLKQMSPNARQAQMASAALKNAAARQASMQGRATPPTRTTGTLGSQTAKTGLGDAMRGLGAVNNVARGIAGSDLKRAGLMKKGGAVKKKVTKK